MRDRPVQPLFPAAWVYFKRWRSLRWFLLLMIPVAISAAAAVSRGRILGCAALLIMGGLAAALLFAALCGWALVEPAAAERVPDCLLWGTVPFAIILLRACWRALRSLRRSSDGALAATVGLWRPRIVVAPRLAEALDPDALAAAVEHERMHARHRDPLRMWLAQLGTDLLWPWPSAGARFLFWRRSIDLARDEEARLNGVAGPDLAAAILGALRYSRGPVPAHVVTLTGDESFVAERIARLLRPLELDAPRARRRGAMWMLALAIAAATACGTAFGERVVHTLLAVV